MAAVELETVRAALERGIVLGWHTGAQLYASVRGQTVADLAVGEARPGVPMSPSTLVEWASATKAITCTAAALLWQRGLFDLDDPVCRHVPEFATNGKEAVTIRHLLTHTAELSDPIQDIMPWDQAVAAVSRAPLVDGWVPGKRCGYNSVAMWAVAALVVRLTGTVFAEFVRAEIFEPLGLRDSWIGMPVDVYHAYRDRFAVVPGFARSGTEEWVTWGRPTGGGHGPIGDLGRFHAALLEHRLLSAPVLEAMTTRHLCRVYDETLRATVDRGLGFQLGSSYAGHSFGPHASHRAFGHGGGGWCQAVADPEHGLAVAVYWNGKTDNRAHAERQTSLLAAVYEDLGLA
jgi:CubicO group peptidase (beta-lactamase class C family)